MKNRYSRNVTFMFRRKSPARRLCCCQHLNAGSHIDNLCIYLFCHFEVWLPARFLAFHQQSNPNTPVFLWRRWDSNSRPPACKADVLTNWTTTPLDTRVGFEPTNNSFVDCSLNRLGNGWILLRMVKDSNFRYAFTYDTLAMCCLKPLGQPSKICCGSGTCLPPLGYEPNMRLSHCYRDIEKPTTFHKFSACVLT